MAGVVIDLHQAKVVSRHLKKAARDAERMTAAMEDVGEIVVNSIRRNFDEGGRPVKWPERKSSRSKKKLLIDSSDLINSIVKEASALHVDVGTVVEYAAAQHFGTGGVSAEGPAQWILARPFLMLQDEDMRPIRDAILEHLTGAFD